MNVFDYAIKMEKDGEAYYRKLARNAPSKAFAAIFILLAEEEVKHRQVLERIRKDRRPEMKAGRLRKSVRNIFARLIRQNVKLQTEKSAISLYRKARDIEQDSRDFYLDKAREIDTVAGRELFYRIADEERLHYLMLESLIEFVMRPHPGRWLENAEWYHLDEY